LSAALMSLGQQPPLALRHDPHHLEGEEGRLLHQESESPLTHWHELADGPGSDGSTPWPRDYQRHLPYNPAWPGRVDNSPLHHNFDFAFEHRIHDIPGLTLAKNDLARGKDHAV